MKDRVPRQATTSADTEIQQIALTTAVRSCRVVVEYVDANVGIADAQEELTGRRVCIGSNTAGIELRTLRVGTRLLAAVTAYDFIARAEVI